MRPVEQQPAVGVVAGVVSAGFACVVAVVKKWRRVVAAVRRARRRRSLSITNLLIRPLPTSTELAPTVVVEPVLEWVPVGMNHFQVRAVLHFQQLSENLYDQCELVVGLVRLKPSLVKVEQGWRRALVDVAVDSTL